MNAELKVVYDVRKSFRINYIKFLEPSAGLQFMPMGGVELLESSVVRPRQTRYQATLRARLLFDRLRFHGSSEFEDDLTLLT